MSGLYVRLIGGALVIVLIAAVALLLVANGSKSREIRDLKGDLATAAQALKQASRDIERFSQKESAIAAEAARLCAAEGDSAFGRGLEMGVALCVARR